MICCLVLKKKRLASSNLMFRTLFGEVGAAIPISVREVKKWNESEDTRKGLLTKGDIVVEVKM